MLVKRQILHKRKGDVVLDECVVNPGSLEGVHFWAPVRGPLQSCLTKKKEHPECGHHTPWSPDTDYKGRRMLSDCRGSGIPTSQSRLHTCLPGTTRCVSSNCEPKQAVL